jgi:regulator of protease activity HflC (stomatin/prohibitin superfamily)
MAYTNAELNRLHNEAHQQARVLRAQALADFWRGADALVHDAAHGAYRSAQRLAYRLARRRAAQTVAAANAPCGATRSAP